MENIRPLLQEELADCDADELCLGLYAVAKGISFLHDQVGAAVPSPRPPSNEYSPQDYPLYFAIDALTLGRRSARLHTATSAQSASLWGWTIMDGDSQASRLPTRLLK
jgi:hypothetical protein